MHDSKPWMMPGRAAVAAYVGLATLGGCATFPPQGKPTTRDPSPPAAAAPVQLSHEDEKEGALALVEDFLERTRHYSQPAPVEAPTPASTPAASPPSSPPVVRDPAAPDRVVVNEQVSIAPEPPSRPQQPIPAVQAVLVRAPDPVRPAIEETRRGKAANAPADLMADETTALATRFLEQLAAQSSAQKNLDAEWRLRLVQLAMGQQTQAEEVSAELAEPARTLLVSLIRTAIAVREALRRPSETHADSLQRVAQLQQVLADRADPTIIAATLCRKVVTFGSYEEMPPEDFVAGRTIPTIVYCEIANLRSETTEAGLQESRLATRLEVLTPAGQSVWQREEPEIVDRCRSRRRDFFVAQRITLPPSLPAGDYVLKVQVEDKIAEKLDEASVTFTVSSPVSLAQNKKP